MKKIFWENPYQTELVTDVLSVNNQEIIFAESIIYSFAGGQESDEAWINDRPVLSSRYENNVIIYTLAQGHNLQPGNQVVMKINGSRRMNLMRLHFAAELILEIVTQRYHFTKIGAHIAEHKARIDFLAGQNIKIYFEEILNLYNDKIKKNLIIETGYSDRLNERRFWKIEGFAEVPCGGTHVKSTGEVGFINIKREHPGKGIERIEIRLSHPTEPNQALTK